MSVFTRARRVGSFDGIGQAGDYCLDTVIWTDGQERRRLLFLLPVHHGADVFDHADQGSGLHGIYEPPWTFTEHPDGSVSADPSIGCGPQPYYWHGYLRPGNQWEQLPS